MKKKYIGFNRLISYKYRIYYNLILKIKINLNFSFELLNKNVQFYQ